MIAWGIVAGLAGFVAGGGASGLAERLAHISRPWCLPAGAVTGGVLAVWGLAVIPPEAAVPSLLLAWTLLVLALVDLLDLRLPNVLTFGLAAAGLAYAAATPGEGLLDHGLGLVAGYALLAGLAAGFRRWRGVDGLGLGDAKLLAAGGAWLGWAALPSVLLLASGSALAVVGLRVLLGRPLDRTEVLPLGPSLALAIWLVWLYGPLAAL